jgi:hypothetical protein
MVSGLLIGFVALFKHFRGNCQSMVLRGFGSPFAFPVRNIVNQMG